MLLLEQAISTSCFLFTLHMRLDNYPRNWWELQLWLDASRKMMYRLAQGDGRLSATVPFALHQFQTDGIGLLLCWSLSVEVE